MLEYKTTKGRIGFCIKQAFITAYLEETRGQRVRIINFFGLRDNDSWIDEVLHYPDADPLLFDDEGQVKPAYYAVLQALYEEALQH